MTFSTLRDLLNQYFNEAELRQLCFDLSIEYENLAGEVRLSKAQSLVEFGLRNGRLPDQIARCQELRPTVQWPDVTTIADEWIKIQQGIIVQEKLQGILPVSRWQ